MPFLDQARPPYGMRIYAIGDVHGQLEALLTRHEAVMEDLAKRPVEDYRVVHVGDYVDRGPDSRGVIDYIVNVAPDPKMVFLLGNHDRSFAQFVADDPDVWARWLDYGGVETCLSYGVPFNDIKDTKAGREILRCSLRERTPESHLAFLNSGLFQISLGGFMFVHAGVDPTKPLAEQTEQDLTWIRKPFLNSDADFGPVIVHGHTPVKQIEAHPNRIAIDTGAGHDGPLSCLVIEEDMLGELGSGGYAPLP